MKLKTVSALVLAFSLLCLAAFVAGHPPTPRRSNTVTTANQQPLRIQPQNAAHPTTAR
jgi:hypothetical protein